MGLSGNTASGCPETLLPITNKTPYINQQFSSFSILLLGTASRRRFAWHPLAVAALPWKMPSLRSERLLLSLQRPTASPLRGAAPSALRLPPRVRHVAGVRGTAYGLKTPTPQHLNVCRYVQRQGFGFAHVLTRSVLGLRPALRMRLPCVPLTLAFARGALNGKGVKL